MHFRKREINYPRVILSIRKGEKGEREEGERRRRDTRHAGFIVVVVVDRARYAVYADVCHFNARASVQLGTLVIIE